MARGVPLQQLTGSMLGTLGTATGHVANATAPINIPGPGDLLEALATRLLSERQVSRMLRFHGIHFGSPPGTPPTISAADAAELTTLWHAVLDLRYDLPTNDQLVQLYNRGTLSSVKFANALRRNGVHPDWLASWQELARLIPGPADLVSFVIREVFSPAQIVALGYNAEYPRVFEDWLAKQGLVYPIDSPEHEQAGLGKLNWAKAYWWAHWQLPAVGQGITMYQRLRGTLKDATVPRDPSGIIFTRADLEALLKAADYPPYWRDRLLQIGYVPIGIRNLRALWDTQLVDEVEVAEIFMDQGFNRRDALTQARLIATEKDVQAFASARKTLGNHVLRHYQMGLLSQEDAQILYHRSRLRTQDQIAAYDLKPRADQIAEAIADRVTVMEVDLTDLAVQQQQLQRTMRLLQKAFWRLTLNRQQVRERLIQLGMVAARADGLLDEWQLELLTVRRQATVSQLLKWYGRGQITTAQARDQLQLLGYDAGTIDNLLIDGALAEVSRRVNAVKAAAAGQRREQSLAASQARAAQRVLRQAQLTLRRSASPARLQRWLQDGLIDEAEFRSRMLALQVAPEDVDRTVALVRMLQAEEAAKAQAKVLAQVVPAPAKAKRVPVATVGGWYKKKLIDRAEFERRLAALGYDPESISKYEVQYAPA